MNTVTTFNGLHLDRPTSDAVRRLLAEVATMHHVEGDALGEMARALLRTLPPPYEHRPHKRSAPQPDKQRDAEWWESKDKPDGN